MLSILETKILWVTENAALPHMLWYRDELGAAPGLPAARSQGRGALARRDRTAMHSLIQRSASSAQCETLNARAKQLSELHGCQHSVAFIYDGVFGLGLCELQIKMSKPYLLSEAFWWGTNLSCCLAASSQVMKSQGSRAGESLTRSAVFMQLWWRVHLALLKWWS